MCHNVCIKYLVKLQRASRAQLLSATEQNSTVWGYALELWPSATSALQDWGFEYFVHTQLSYALIHLVMVCAFKNMKQIPLDNSECMVPWTDIRIHEILTMLFAMRVQEKDYYCLPEVFSKADLRLPCVCICCLLLLVLPEYNSVITLSERKVEMMYIFYLSLDMFGNVYCCKGTLSMWNSLLTLADTVNWKSVFTFLVFFPDCFPLLSEQNSKKLLIFLRCFIQFLDCASLR